MTIFFVPYFVLNSCYIRDELRKKYFLPWNTIEMLDDRNGMKKKKTFREKTDNHNSYLSYFNRNSSGTLDWNFYPYFLKSFWFAFCTRTFLTCFIIEKFLSMLVKLCNVFYRPRPMFMVAGLFIFTLCIKLTQHKHLPLPFQ